MSQTTASEGDVNGGAVQSAGGGGGTPDAGDGLSGGGGVGPAVDGAAGGPAPDGTPPVGGGPVQDIAGALLAGVADAAPAQETKDAPPLAGDWGSYDPGIPADSKNFDGEFLKELGATVKDAGMTVPQVQKLLAWYDGKMNTARDAMLDKCQKELLTAWGAKYVENVRGCSEFLSRVDKAAGNTEFSEAVTASGAFMLPGFVKGLAVLAKSFVEDSVGGGGGVGGKGPVEKDFVDTLQNIWNESK